MPEPQDLAQSRASFSLAEHTFAPCERAFTSVEQGIPATGGSVPRLPRGLRSADHCASKYRFNEAHVGETRVVEYRISDPRLSELRISDPRVSDPRVSDPRVSDPRVSDPRVGDPRAEVHPVESGSVALVVDSDRNVARLLTALLAPDFSVLCVSTVAEALSWLRAIPRVDVAFVADDLPDGFGAHLFPWLREHYPQAPRVLMSSSDRNRFRHADVESAHVLLTKPLNPRWVRCIGSAGVLRK